MTPAFFRILLPIFVLMFGPNLFGMELGDPARFALRFDDVSGHLAEIVYRGEAITVPGATEQRFDIRKRPPKNTGPWSP